MRKTTPQRTPAQRKADYAKMLEKPCICTHYDALTCTCRQYRMSRLDAILTHGACDCPCHRNNLNQQVTEQAWITAKAKQAKKVSA